MKIAISALVVGYAAAFAPSHLKTVRSALHMAPHGHGGMDAYDAYLKQTQGGGAPAAPAPPAPPAPAGPAPPAAPPAVEEEEDKVPTAFNYGEVDYDPSKDVFPTFPPDYPTFDEIWAKYQAKKATGAFDRISAVPE